MDSRCIGISTKLECCRSPAFVLFFFNKQQGLFQIADMTLFEQNLHSDPLRLVRPSLFFYFFRISASSSTGLRSNEMDIKSKQNNCGFTYQYRSALSALIPFFVQHWQVCAYSNKALSQLQIQCNSCSKPIRESHFAAHAGMHVECMLSPFPRCSRLGQ